MRPPSESGERLVAGLAAMFLALGALAGSASLLAASRCAAAEYYVDDTAGSDRRSGRSPADAWRTLARVERASFQPGDAILLRREGVWEEELVVPSSGEEGRPLRIAAFGKGRNPVIKCSNTFRAWELFSSEGMARIWRGKLEGVLNTWGAALPTGRLTRYYPYRVKGSRWSAPDDVASMADRCFYAPLDEGVFYLRWDAGNPGPIEIGARRHGILVRGRRDIVIEGIDLFGPGGTADRGDKKSERQIQVDASDRVIVRNCALSAHNMGGGAIVNGSSDCAFEGVASIGHGGTGLYFVSAGAGNRAIDCQVSDCGNLDSDRGDMGLIGVWNTRGVAVENCRVWNNGHQGNEKVDAAISFVRSPAGVVRRCSVRDASGTALQFAEMSDDCTAAYNVFDGWGRWGNANANEGVRIGGGMGRSSKNCRILNNLFINGGRTQGNWASLRILNEENRGLRVLNNIFFNNTGVFEVAAESKDSFRDWVFDRNCYYRTEGATIRIGDRVYDARHILGTGPGFYSFDTGRDLHSVAADPKLDLGEKELSKGSPCVDAGAEVGEVLDHAGRRAPFGRAPDIGPFERQG